MLQTRWSNIYCLSVAPKLSIILPIYPSKPLLINHFLLQEELEKLNSSTDVINKLEVDLEVNLTIYFTSENKLLFFSQEARHTFRILMRESSQQLERLGKQIGPSSVEKARPYYEARMRARRAHAEAQRAALR